MWTSIGSRAYWPKYYANFYNVLDFIDYKFPQYLETAALTKTTIADWYYPFWFGRESSYALKTGEFKQSDNVYPLNFLSFQNLFL